MCLNGFLMQNALQLTFCISIRFANTTIIKVAAFHRPLEGYPELQPQPTHLSQAALEAVTER